METNIQELNSDEIEQVAGAGFASTLGYAVGYACAMGAAMMKSIDAMDNGMLSAMQYGA